MPGDCDTYPQLHGAKARLNSIGEVLVRDGQTHHGRLDYRHPELVAILAEPQNNVMRIFVVPIKSLKLLVLVVVELHQPYQPIRLTSDIHEYLLTHS